MAYDREDGIDQEDKDKKKEEELIKKIRAEMGKEENDKKILDAVKKEVKTKVINDIICNKDVAEYLTDIARNKQYKINEEVRKKALEDDKNRRLSILHRRRTSPDNQIAVFFKTKEGNKELFKIPFFRYAAVFENEIIYDEKRDAGCIDRWTEKKLLITRTYPSLSYIEGRVTPINYENTRLPVDEALLSRKVNADYNMQMHEAKRTGLGGVEEKTGMIIAFVCGIFAGFIIPYIGGF